MTPSSIPNISGDDLSELKRYVLEASRKLLVENVDAPRFLPYFRSRFVLDQRECDEIKSCSRRSRYDGAEKLLDALLTKGSLGYDHFCAAIMYDRTQMFLLTALNKRLEIFRDWRKKQVFADQQITQAQVEMQQRLQQQANRQQMHWNNRTYPMTSRHQPQQLRVQNYQQLQPQCPNPASRDHIPRSPIPNEEETPNGQFPPSQMHQDYYHSSDHQMHQMQQMPQQYHQTHTAQGTGNYYSGYGYQLPGQHYVPPPAPVNVEYPAQVYPMENSAFQDQHVYQHHVLTSNTPSGALMENLLPGMPPVADASAGQTTLKNYHEHDEESLSRVGSHHPLVCNIGASHDILCGQGGN